MDKEFVLSRLGFMMDDCKNLERMWKQVAPYFLSKTLDKGALEESILRLSMAIELSKSEVENE